MSPFVFHPCTSERKPVVGKGSSVGSQEIGIFPLGVVMCRVCLEKEKIHKNRELTGKKLELIVVI